MQILTNFKSYIYFNTFNRSIPKKRIISLYSVISTVSVMDENQYCVT